MNHDELEDRVRALEALNRMLIRYLARNAVLDHEDIESMFDSLIDQASGDPRAEFQAERLKTDIEGEAGSEAARERNRAWLSAQEKALYGRDCPLL